MASVVHGGEAPQREVSLERIFGRAFGTIRANPAATLGISFLFGALPGLLINYFVQGSQLRLMRDVGPWGVVAMGVFSILVALVITAITQGALVRATVSHSQGQEASFGQCIMAGLVVIVPLVVASILSVIGIALGFLLLIVPGVIVYCMWIATTPAVVAERLGPIAAIGRSRYLTSGARWKVFGLVLIMLVAYWAISAAFAGLTFQLFGGMRRFSAQQVTGTIPIAYYVLAAVVQTVTACIWGVIVTSLYVELRDWKDGPRSETLAEVFR